MWMGGLPPLGYDGIDRKLVINEKEAQTVRLIYDTYLKLKSVAALKQYLDEQGVVSKRRQFKDGRVVGGVPMSRGAIYQILRNRLYRGEIAHRGEPRRDDDDRRVDIGGQGVLEPGVRRVGSHDLCGPRFDRTDAQGIARVMCRCWLHSSCLLLVITTQPFVRKRYSRETIQYQFGIKPFCQRVIAIFSVLAVAYKKK